MNTPQQAQPYYWDESPHPGRRFVLQFVEGNYFYVVSAVLMMLGCYTLMHSSAIQGTEFTRTLKTLLILQAYEVLLIATAWIIVRRLGVLDDAFTLLVLELVLLLDPTFFANSFFTMHSDESTAVNVVCWALVPVKLLVLQFALGFRLTPRMFAGFLFAAAFVFLAERPLAFWKDPVERGEYYYVLAWLPFAIGLLLPPMKSMVSFRRTEEAYATDAQRARLPVFLMILPVGIAAAHFIESAFVYTHALRPVHFVPLVLAGAALIVGNVDRTTERDKIALRCIAVDLLAVVAIALSIGSELSPEQASFTPTAQIPPPPLLETHLPLILAGSAVVGLYFYFKLRTGYGPAMYRIYALAAAVVAAVVGKSAWPYLVDIGQTAWAYLVTSAEVAGAFLKQMAEAAPLYLLEHFTKPGIVIVGLALALALCFRRRWWGWALFAATAVVWFGNLMPQALWREMPRVYESLIIVALLLDHIVARSKPSSQRRQYMALAIVLIALFRYFDDPAAWKLAVAGIECLAIVAAGLWLRIAYYPTIGIIGCALLMFGVARYSEVKIHPAWLILLAGLAFFALGILVTFSKKHIVAWAESFEAPMAPAGASVSASAPSQQRQRFVLPVRFDSEPEPPEVKEKLHEGRTAGEIREGQKEDEELTQERTDPRLEDPSPEESRESEVHEDVEEPKLETEGTRSEESDRPEEPAPTPMEEGPDEAGPPSERAPFVVTAFQDLEPDVLARIRETARLSDDEIPLTVIGRSTTFEDWSVVVTRERVIVRVTG